MRNGGSRGLLPRRGVVTQIGFGCSTEASVTRRACSEDRSYSLGLGHCLVDVAGFKPTCTMSPRELLTSPTETNRSNTATVILVGSAREPRCPFFEVGLLVEPNQGVSVQADDVHGHRLFPPYGHICAGHQGRVGHALAAWQRGAVVFAVWTVLSRKGSLEAHHAGTTAFEHDCPDARWSCRFVLSCSSSTRNDGTRS